MEETKGRWRQQADGTHLAGNPFTTVRSLCSKVKPHLGPPACFVDCCTRWFGRHCIGVE
jgi:hypothetical protein